MTTLRQIFSLLALIFCLTTVAQTSPTSLKLDSTKKIVPFKQKGTTYWVDNFRQFRDAISKKDKTKSKVFFNFPIKDSSNEIWYLAYDQNEKAIDKLRDIVKPFTEAAFYKYFDKIFTKNFVKSLLKIKADELYKRGTYQTLEFKDSSTTYILYSTYNKTENTLEFNFASKTEYKDEKGESLDSGEFNVIYYFEITKKGHVKFKQIRLAG
jgi:hypothetical protein